MILWRTKGLFSDLQTSMLPFPGTSARWLAHQVRAKAGRPRRINKLYQPARIHAGLSDHCDSPHCSHHRR